MKEINVLVTGAAGQIGYALLTRLASGETFGKDVKVNLNLVEVPQVVSRLEGARMELEDCGFNTLGAIKSFSDINEASGDIDWALLVGSIPRGITVNGKKIEERADLLKINGGIFTEQGKALGENAKEDAKILVVGNKNDFTREELFEKFPSARTFPQITMDGILIGGYTEFSAKILEES